MLSLYRWPYNEESNQHGSPSSPILPPSKYFPPLSPLLVPFNDQPPSYHQHIVMIIIMMVAPTKRVSIRCYAILMYRRIIIIELSQCCIVCPVVCHLLSCLPLFTTPLVFLLLLLVAIVNPSPERTHYLARCTTTFQVTTSSSYDKVHIHSSRWPPMPLPPLMTHSRSFNSIAPIYSMLLLLPTHLARS